jgi:nicotinamidase-related amidase
MPDDTAPQYAHSALITIDVQQDFLDGEPFEIAGTSAAIPSMTRLTGFFRHKNRPIVHVVRLYRPDGSNAEPCRRDILEHGTSLVRPGSTGSQLAAALFERPDVALDAELLLSGGIQSVGPNESIVYKPRWGAFFGTPLEAHLRGLSVSTLVFAGCNFPNCPRTSIYEASERDFRVVAINDAISGFYDRGGTELEGIGVRVMDTASFLAQAGQF